MSLYGDLPPPSIGATESSLSADSKTDVKSPSPSSSSSSSSSSASSSNNTNNNNNNNNNNTNNSTSSNPTGWVARPFFAPIVRRPPPKPQTKPKSVFTPIVSVKTDNHSQVQSQHLAAAAQTIQKSELKMIVMDASFNVGDEYDPAFPNQYDKIMKERARIQAQREMEEELSRKRQREDRERERDRERDRYDRDRERDRDRKKPDDDVPLDISGEDAFLARARLSFGNQPPETQLNLPPQKKPTGEAAAQKIMEKMGWKGQGLGKSEQGMSAPLTVQKTGKTQGIITAAAPKINEKAVNQIMQQQQQQQQQPKPKPVGNPSRVILLRNMSTPSDVDESLQEETAEECSQFGKVEKCLIFVVQGVSIDQAVRIFVKFSQQESATLALNSLNGRYFDKRRVRATYFEEERFNKLDLAPTFQELND